MKAFQRNHGPIDRDDDDDDRYWDVVVQPENGGRLRKLLAEVESFSTFKMPSGVGQGQSFLQWIQNSAGQTSRSSSRSLTEQMVEEEKQQDTESSVDLEEGVTEEMDSSEDSIAAPEVRDDIQAPSSDGEEKVLPRSPPRHQKHMEDVLNDIIIPPVELAVATVRKVRLPWHEMWTKMNFQLRALILEMIPHHSFLFSILR